MIKKYDVKIRVFNENPSFGKGIVFLLEGVEKYGSVLKATQAMDMAPSKAYKILNRAEADLGFQLIESKAGGTHGGGSTLTEEARDLMKRYKLFVQAINKAADDAFKEYF